MGLYTNADDPLDTLRRTATASPGSPYTDSLKRGSPSAPAMEPTVSPTEAAPTTNAAKPGLISRVASGAANLLGNVARVGTVANGFMDGAGLSFNKPPSSGATPGANQPGTDVPVDMTDETKARLAQMSPSTPEDRSNPVINYLKDSRDGLISGFQNRSMDTARGIVQALPIGRTANALGILGNAFPKIAAIGTMGTEGALLDRAGYGIGQGAVATGFVQPPAGPLARAAGATPQQPKTPAQINADEAAKKVSAAIAANPQLGGVQRDNRQITQLSGGQFANPMFTDDPDRAIREASRNPINDPRLAMKRQIIGDDGLPQTYTYTPDDNKASPSQSYGPLQTRAMGTVQQAGDRINVMPSTAASDKAYLNGAFARHIASGDLDRARATIDPNNEAQQAQFGAAENAQVSARNAAYSAAPEQRMLQDYIQSKIDADKRGGGIRDHAFGGPFRGGKGGQGGAAGLDPGIIAGLQASIAASKGQQTDPGKAAADALTAYNANQASKTNIIGQNLAQQGQQLAQQRDMIGTKALEKLQLETDRFNKETDPEKRAIISENLAEMTRKFEKPAPQSKAVIEEYLSDVKDNMGNPIKLKRAIDRDTGEALFKPAAAKPPTREEIIADAKKSFKNDPSAKARINAEAKKLYNFEPL